MTTNIPKTGSVLRLLFPMSRTDYSPLPLPCLRRTVWAFTGHSARACRLVRPLLTSAARSAPIARCPVHTCSMWTERQISRGKFDHFQHTTGGSTSAALMEQHFVAEGPLVPAAGGLISASCSSARAFALRFFQTRPRGRSPCASLPFTSIWLVEDFHLQVVEHARHTFSPRYAR